MCPKLRNMTTVYLKRGGKYLLLYRQGGSVVNNVWTGSAGGHFEKEELCDPEACVLRELYEELGVTADEITGLKLRYVTIRQTGSELRQNYYFFAELPDDFTRALSSNEGTLSWFDADTLLTLPMPFTAKFMVEHYLSVGSKNDILYGGISTEEDVLFTAMGCVFPIKK